jgi:hypothetical protein
LLTITYDDGSTASAVASEATAEEIAEDIGLVVLEANVEDGSRLWGRLGTSQQAAT